MIKVEEIESGREAFENTPLGEDRFRLDSSGVGPWSRWSYRAANPSLILIGNHDGIGNLPDKKAFVEPQMAFDWLDSTLKHEPVDGPPFKGGWIGHLSYNLGWWFEKLPFNPTQVDLCWPTFIFTWHDRVIAHDWSTGRNFLCSATTPARAIEIDFDSKYHIDVHVLGSKRLTEEGYELAVSKALSYIAAGGVFQVNLAQRFELPMRRPPADVYRDLRTKYPASFGALLDYGGYQLISNSPELFLRVDGQRKIITRPIKGTRPRRQGMEKELRESKKDQAELNMIVDLERNDLGRICEIGSVKVTNPREIEAHPTVYHGVATIEGQLRKNIGLSELLKATFPGGSVTGAPKIRAMEIIDELEPVRRGPYCGAIGYLSADGQMQFNIAIRTIVVIGEIAYVSVGGGIVADSNPNDEYEETLVKARAMFDVLGVNDSMIQ